MTSTWDELANGPRWRGLVSFIRQWVGPFDAHHGMPPDELDELLQAKPLNVSAAIREWYLLAANWRQGGLGIWIHPRDLTVRDGMIGLLTDTEGINLWGVRVEGLSIEDPPVYRECDPDEIDFPSFSTFVGAMIANDVIVDYETEAPIELDPTAALADLTCLVSARCGQFYADAPLGSATVVVFACAGQSVIGKSRTPEGEARLQRLRSRTD